MVIRSCRSSMQSCPSKQPYVLAAGLEQEVKRQGGQSLGTRSVHGCRASGRLSARRVRQGQVPCCVRCVSGGKMKRLIALILGLAAVTTLLAAPEGGDGKRWWSYVEALANDGMQGRNTGIPEHRKAAEYV